MSRKITYVRYIGLAILTCGTFFPFLWMISVSFRTPQELWDLVIIPKNPVLTNYIEVFTKTAYFQFFLNSIFIASCVTATSMVIALFAGYALSRFNFKEIQGYGLFILMMQMFPGVLLVIPLFLLFRKINLINTYPAIIIAHIAFTLPFSTWMLWSFLDGIPIEMEEAAIIDGCSRFKTLLVIVLPLMAPALVAVAIFCFLLSWNEFLFALLLVQDETLRTLPVGISLFVQQFNYDWGLMMAASVITCIPVVVFFLFVQRYLIQGLTGGAVKG